MENLKIILSSVAAIIALVVIYILGANYGIYPIKYIIPIVIILAIPLYKYMYKDETKRMKELHNPLPSKLDIALQVSGLSLFFIVFLIVLLWFGSCSNIFDRNPDTPQNLELRYKIWRNNNPE